MKFWLCVESKRIWWMISEFLSNRSIKMWCSFAPLSILSSNSAGMKGSYPLSTISAVQTYISSQLLRTEVCLSQKRLSCSYAGVCLCEVCLPDVLLSLQAVIWSTKLLSVPGCWLLSLMRPVDPLIHKLDYTYKQLFFLHFRGHYKGLHTYIQRRLKFEVLKHTLSLGNFIFRLWPALQSKFNILR